MTLVVVAIVVAATLVALAALVVLRPLLAGRAELVDPAGIRSTLVFELVPGQEAVLEGEPTAAPPPTVLDGIVAALERAGTETSRWSVVASVLELEGQLHDAAFRLTLGPIGDRSFVLVVHASTLGRRRWVAPPATDAMRAVLRAIDAGVRRAPGMAFVGWRQRQDDPRGDDVRSTPCD